MAVGTVTLVIVGAVTSIVTVYAGAEKTLVFKKASVAVTENE
jgi:hypothetical protein